MKILVQRSELEHPVPARLVETARGTEVRGEHLLGVVNNAGQLVIKLRDEFLIVEDMEA